MRKKSSCLLINTIRSNRSSQTNSTRSSTYLVVLKLVEDDESDVVGEGDEEEQQHIHQGLHAFEPAELVSKLGRHGSKDRALTAFREGVQSLELAENQVVEESPQQSRRWLVLGYDALALVESE